MIESGRDIFICAARVIFRQLCFVDKGPGHVLQTLREADSFPSSCMIDLLYE